MKKNKDYEISSGNVFQDLGFEDFEEKLTKAELARQINSIIDQRELSQSDAAKLLNIDQPKVSALNKGKLVGFSLERLFRFLNILGQNITIKVSPKNNSKKKASVVVSLPNKKVNIKKKNNISNGRQSIQAKKAK